MNTLPSVRRITLGLAILTFVLVACRCSLAIGTECAVHTRDMIFADPDQDLFMECGEYLSLACPDADETVPGAVEAELACIDAAGDAWANGGQPPVPNYPTKAGVGVTSGDAPEGLPDFGGQSVAPPEIVIEEPVDCSTFAITAPGDGLANGMNSLGWSLPTGGTFGYRIYLRDENGNLLRSFNLLYSTDNFQTDMSQAAIGGAYQIIVQIEAIRGADPVCTTSRTYLREAGNAGAPQPQPTDLIIIIFPTIEPTPEPPR